jgi:hypothetical protein
VIFFNIESRATLSLFLTQEFLFEAWDEVTGEWREFHNEELHDLYSSPTVVRVMKSIIMRWAGRVARMGEGTGVYRVLVGKPEGKRTQGRSRRRWEDNIKAELSWLRITTGGGHL